MQNQYCNAKGIITSALSKWPNDAELNKACKEVESWIRTHAPKLDDFDIGEELGVGNFTNIYLVTHEETNEEFALKCIDSIKVNHLKKQNDVVMERHVLSRLSHPNVVRLYQTFKDDCFVYLLMELAPDKELWDLCRNVGLPTDTAFYYLTQVISTLEYIHGEGIIHRDIKGENLMLSQGKIKFIDFGTAKDVKYPELTGSGNQCQRKTFLNYVGTPNFMAPEVIRNKVADICSDLYSVGALIYQVFAGCPPFQAGSEYLIFLRVMDKDLIFPPMFPEAVETLVRQLMEHDRDIRSTLQDVKQSAMWGAPFEEVSQRPQPVLPLSWFCQKRWANAAEDEIPSIPEDAPPEVRPIYERLQLIRTWDLESRAGHGPTPKLERLMAESLETPSVTIPLRPGKTRGDDSD
eukprot:GEMP01040668.1.p1 GENE.GEMP01040668.1~~GEMP01040668.1.p1  ORF type:complete len:406 (+),score=89.34 GEMP01040668.1:362-1579(+)